MAVRGFPQHVDAGTMTVIFAIAIAIGALTRMAGFSPVSAVLVGGSTGTICWWALRSEP
jgi:hypothetical protein